MSPGSQIYVVAAGKDSTLSLLVKKLVKVRCHLQNVAFTLLPLVSNCVFSLYTNFWSKLYS